jgi:DNA polymerase-3 subunit chi
MAGEGGDRKGEAGDRATTEGAGALAEVLFYHLERQPLEAVLPPLLEKCLERGWRAAVQLPDPERLAALDTHLWTYREDAFLPHGTASDGFPERQPIFLTTGPENPNGARVRFLAGGAELPDARGYLRVVHLFDGHDETAVAAARARWTEARRAGHAVTYWRQSERGRWERKA